MHDHKAVNYRFKFLSLIGILAVVCGHIGSQLVSPDWLFAYDSFHMPLFAFISGYFFRPPQGFRQAITAIGKKVRKQLIPLWAWNAFYLFWAYIIRTKTEIPMVMGYNYVTIGHVLLDPFLWETGTDRVSGPLNIASWYVATFFLVQIMAYFFYAALPKKFQKSNWSMLFFALLGIAAVYFTKQEQFLLLRPYSAILTRAVYLLFWFNAGYFYNIIYEKLEEKIPDWCVFLFTVSGYILLSFIHYSKGLEMITGVYANSFQFGFVETVFIAGIGIWFWLRVAKHFEPIMRATKLPLYIADHTFDIMMHHGFCFWMVNCLFYILSTQNIPFAQHFSADIFSRTTWYAYIPHNTLAPLRIVYIVLAIGIPLGTRWIYTKLLKFTKKYLESKDIRFLHR